MIETALKGIGLTEGEIKIYLALLELGNSTTWNIIKRSGISGSKTYEILERLLKKGLIASIVKNNTKYFEASDPSRILDYLEEKNQEIEKEKIEVKKIIPELILKQKASKKAEAKIYVGFEGAKTAYEDAIQSCKKGDEILGWGLTEQPESWEIYFNKREKERGEKGIVHKSIINENYKSLYSYRKNLPKTQIRFFPKDMQMPTTIEIWKNKVALFVINKENPITIVMESKDIADSFRKSFEVMWNSAKK